MKRGILYLIVNKVLLALKYVCLVELFKFVGFKLLPEVHTIEQELKCSRMSVDVFILFKWLYLLLLWIFEFKNPILVSIVWYLIVTNLFTYFYYHTWSDKILNDFNFDVDRIKRRFFNLILALSFSFFAFAYLYNIPYSSDFIWKGNKPNFVYAIWYSITNSLTANFEFVKPITNYGYSISIIQLLMMFVFVAIIIAGSIPQINTLKMEERNGLQE